MGYSTKNISRLKWMSEIQILQHESKQFGGHAAMAYYLFFNEFSEVMAVVGPRLSPILVLLYS
jgi:hypothetical protein